MTNVCFAETLIRLGHGNGDCLGNMVFMPLSMKIISVFKGLATRLRTN
jgi:hypothetical protein